MLKLAPTFSWFAYDTNVWAHDPHATLYDAIEGLRAPGPSLFFAPSAKAKTRRQLEALQFLHTQAKEAISQALPALLSGKSLAKAMSFVKTVARLLPFHRELQRATLQPLNHLDFEGMILLILPPIWSALDRAIELLFNDIILYSQVAGDLTAATHNSTSATTAPATLTPTPVPVCAAAAPATATRPSTTAPTPSALSIPSSSRVPDLSELAPSNRMGELSDETLSHLAQSQGLLLAGAAEDVGPALLAPDSPQEPAVLSQRATLTDDMDALLPTGESQLVPAFTATLVSLTHHDAVSHTLPTPATFTPPLLAASPPTLVTSNAVPPAADITLQVRRPARPAHDAPAMRPLSSHLRGSGPRAHRQAGPQSAEVLQLVTDPLELVPVPMHDVSQLLNPDGSLQVVNYIHVFSRQVLANFKQLDRYPFRYLKDHNQNLHTLLRNFLDPVLFADFRVLDQGHPEKLRKLYASMTGMVNALVFDLAALRDRYTYLFQLCAPYSVDLLGNKNINHRVTFWNDSQAALKAVFECTEPPEFPVQIPNLLECVVGKPALTITSSKHYANFQLQYHQLKFDMARYSVATQCTYPRLVPNLSTFDCKPYLLIASFGEWVVLARTYKLYLDKLLKLSNWWTLILRGMHETLETMHPFSPEAEFDSYRQLRK